MVELSNQSQPNTMGLPVQSFVYQFHGQAVLKRTSLTNFFIVAQLIQKPIWADISSATTASMVNLVNESNPSLK